MEDEFQFFRLPTKLEKITLCSLPFLFISAVVCLLMGLFPYSILASILVFYLFIIGTPFFTKIVFTDCGFESKWFFIVNNVNWNDIVSMSKIEEGYAGDEAEHRYQIKTSLGKSITFPYVNNKKFIDFEDLICAKASLERTSNKSTHHFWSLFKSRFERWTRRGQAYTPTGLWDLSNGIEWM